MKVKGAITRIGGLIGASLVALLSQHGIAQDQPSAAMLDEPGVRDVLEFVRRTEPETIQDQIRLCEIPAPPFGEAARATAYASAMRKIGLSNVRIDAEGNVLGERRGRSARPNLVLAAHLDTVFPANTPVRVTRDGAWLKGAGIGDNCRGLAVLLAVARALEASRFQTGGSITFVGTVGEEGLGDLRGVKALLRSTLKGQIDRFLAVDGDGYAVTTAGVGSHRYRVTYRGPGGHSYEDFGRASPINAVASAVAALSRTVVLTDPGTTINVGRIGGGTSINAIASDAWFEVDLRSSDQRELASLDTRFRASVQDALQTENARRTRSQPLTVTIELVGSRPAARTDPDGPLVEAARTTLRTLGLPVRLDQGSTDANLPMSVGIPALTVGGGGRGREAHTTRESFDTTDSWKGTQMVTLLALVSSR